MDDEAVNAIVTIAEMIETLSQYPDEMPVVVRGYEGGYTSPDTVYATNLAPLGYTPTYEGEFEDYWDFEEHPPFAAVVIPR